MNNKFFFALMVIFLSHDTDLVACMQYEGHYPPQWRWQIPISSKQEAIVDTLFRQSSVDLLAEYCAQQENHGLNNVLLERIGYYKNISEQRYFKDALYRSLAKICLISQVSRLKDPAEIISMYITEQNDGYYTLVSIPPVINVHNEQARAAIRHAIQCYDNPEEHPKRLKKKGRSS